MSDMTETLDLTPDDVAEMLTYVAEPDAAADILSAESAHTDTDVELTAEAAAIPGEWQHDVDGRVRLTGDVDYPGEELEPGRVLMLGVEGPEVVWLQGKLNALMLGDHVAVDGVYGPDTADAVTRMQSAVGRTTNGIVDAGTLRAIRANV